MSGFPGFLSSLVGPFLPATPVPAEVENTTHRTVVVDEVTPCASSSSPRSLGGDLNVEPDSLRRARERLQRAELEVDLARSDLMLREARYANQRPTWQAEP